jgi:phosphoglycerol transferase MdoB-like AlkP superfamily enzyme
MPYWRHGKSGNNEGSMNKRMLSLVPHRYRNLALVALVFLGVNTLVRLGLISFEREWASFAPVALLRILGTGLLYDIAALSWVLLVFGVLALVFGNGPRGRNLYSITHQVVLFLAVFGLLFVATSEFIFWNEFSSRFNFIAVDYLIYTREVIGNIRESYPVGWIFAGFGVFSAGILWLLWPRTWAYAKGDGGTWPRRLALSAIIALGPLVSWFVVTDAPRERMAAAAQKEFVGNGYYDFMRAFRANDLDYRSFYATVPTEQAGAILLDEVRHANPQAVALPGKHALAKVVAQRADARKLNVVLITIESLGSDLVSSFKGTAGLTPQLDQLSKESLTFTNLYATGLRTVRGLEAVTLSMPPTPGHALPMRKDNKGFQTLGSVLTGLGYDATYLYGGYAYFDNMRDFFGGNGYRVLDRTDIARENITHENVWGVADEDVLGQALRELDRSTASGKPQFMHVMTTSNHRPFTYPAGRVDIASGRGRDGAVKYTDWALGDFLKKAKTKPWFDNTLFVLLADHTSHGRGRTALPPEHYEIPMWIYAPRHVPVQKIDWLASQIDVAPTILGLLGLGYESRFFGHDILLTGASHQRAFMSNYLTVGYMESGKVVELLPRRRVRVTDAVSGAVVPHDVAGVSELINEAIAHYETVADIQRGRTVR